MADTIKAPDYKSYYANNVRFETTVFDLRMFFGEVENREAEGWVVSQKSSVAMTWSQAKIAALYLLVNVIAHEKQNGTVDMPVNLLPPWLLPEDSEAAMEDLVPEVAHKFFSHVDSQAATEEK